MQTKPIIQIGAVLVVAMAGQIPAIGDGVVPIPEKLNIIREAVRNGQLLVSAPKDDAHNILLAQSWGNGFTQQPSCSPSNKC